MDLLLKLIFNPAAVRCQSFGCLHPLYFFNPALNKNKLEKFHVADVKFFSSEASTEVKVQDIPSVSHLLY